jgi:hypothetical protein
MADKKLLEDSEWLFTMLTAILKREGGTLKIPDEQMMEVSKKDIVGLFYDKRDNCTILKLVNPAEVFGESISSIVDSKLDN